MRAQMIGLNIQLRYFVHFSPNFYRGGGKKYEIYIESHLRPFAFQRKQHVANLKQNWGTSTMGL